MSDAIIVALITGGLSLSGVLISNIMAAQNMDAKLEKQHGKRYPCDTYYC